MALRKFIVLSRLILAWRAPACVFVLTLYITHCARVVGFVRRERVRTCYRVATQNNRKQP